MDHNSTRYVARCRVAAAHVQNCGRSPACSHARQTPRSRVVNWRLDRYVHVDSGDLSKRPRERSKRNGGDHMKSMVFILVAYPSLEQCRDALKVATTNVAADYTCAATPLEGRWSQKDSRFVMARQ